MKMEAAHLAPNLHNLFSEISELILSFIAQQQ